MHSDALDELLFVINSKDLAETGGGHNQKGIDFQRAWALSRMFDLENSGAEDFLFLFEAIQDVAEMDSEQLPSKVCIYQVKKKDRGEWKWKDLTSLFDPGQTKAASQNAADIQGSPLGKLYSSVLAIKKLTSEGKFISNAGCDLPLSDGTNAATSISCDLSQLSATHLGPLSKGLDSLHTLDTLPSNPKFIRIEKVPIHPDAPMNYLRGKIVSFLNERSPKHAGQATSLADALLAKIGPLGAKTDSCKTFDELRKERGYSKNEFISSIGTLEQVPDQEGILETWLMQLATEGGTNFMELGRIRVAASRIFRSHVMGGEDPLAKKLIAACDSWLEANHPGTSIKDFLNKAIAELADSHPSFKSAEFTAHFLLRAANKCVDQT